MGALIQAVYVVENAICTGALPNAFNHMLGLCDNEIQ